MDPPPAPPASQNNNILYEPPCAHRAHFLTVSLLFAFILMPIPTRSPLPIHILSGILERIRRQRRQGRATSTLYVSLPAYTAHISLLFPYCFLIVAFEQTQH